MTRFKQKSALPVEELNWKGPTGKLIYIQQLKCRHWRTDIQHNDTQHYDISA
jgi:hypothetical protein